MKKLVLALLSALTLPCIIAQAQAPQAGTEFIIGYRALYVDGVTYSHNTHPSDWFLPNASAPGSAGTTGFDSGIMHFAQVGIGGHMPVSEHVSIGVTVSGLFGGARDEHKNDNDSRPDSNAAFVYSEARFGVATEIVATYHFERWFIGAQGSLSAIFVSSGWDRWGVDETAQSDTQIIPSGGPVIGFMIGEESCFKLSLEAGKGGIGGSAGFVIGF